MWNLTDKFLLPGDEHYYTSTSISLVFGLLLMGALFVFDQVKSCLLLCCKNSYPGGDYNPIVQNFRRGEELSLRLCFSPRNF